METLEQRDNILVRSVCKSVSACIMIATVIVSLMFLAVIVIFMFQ